MAQIIKRLVKGSPLTHAEMDGNFDGLNTELGTKANAADVTTQLASVTSGLASTISSLAPSATIDTTNADNITQGTLAAERVADLSWNKITTDKPTTLDGYGITDAMRAGQVIDGGTFGI